MPLFKRKINLPNPFKIIFRSWLEKKRSKSVDKKYQMPDDLKGPQDSQQTIKEEDDHYTDPTETQESLQRIRDDGYTDPTETQDSQQTIKEEDLPGTQEQRKNTQEVQEPFSMSYEDFLRKNDFRDAPSPEEWAQAHAFMKEKLSKRTLKGKDLSFKVSHKKTGLAHSFLYADGKLYCVHKGKEHGVLGAGNFGRAKLVIDENGELFACKKQNKESKYDQLEKENLLKDLKVNLASSLNEYEGAADALVEELSKKIMAQENSAMNYKDLYHDYQAILEDYKKRHEEEPGFDPVDFDTKAMAAFRDAKKSSKKSKDDIFQMDKNEVELERKMGRHLGDFTRDRVSAEDAMQSSYQVTPYLGVSLKDILNNVELSEEQKIEIALKVTEALQRVHEQDIVHMDLNPGNILIKQTDQGIEAHIIDFGLSRDMKGRDKIGLRDPDFSGRFNLTITPPEIGKVVLVGGAKRLIHNKKNLHYSKQSDVYQLGILMYRELGLNSGELLALEKKMCRVEPQARPSLASVQSTLANHLQQVNEAENVKKHDDNQANDADLDQLALKSASSIYEEAPTKRGKAPEYGSMPATIGGDGNTISDSRGGSMHKEVPGGAANATSSRGATAYDGMPARPDSLEATGYGSMPSTATAADYSMVPASIDKLIEHCQSRIDASKKNQDVFARKGAGMLSFSGPENERINYRERKRELVQNLISTLQDFSKAIESANFGEEDYLAFSEAIDAFKQENKKLDEKLNSHFNQNNMDAKQTYLVVELVDMAKATIDHEARQKIDLSNPSQERSNKLR